MRRMSFTQELKALATTSEQMEAGRLLAAGLLALSAGLAHAWSDGMVVV